MKKLVLLAVTLVMVLSLCLPAGAEPAAEVTKYGNIGRLSKLNITEAWSTASATGMCSTIR